MLRFRCSDAHERDLVTDITVALLSNAHFGNRDAGDEVGGRPSELLRLRAGVSSSSEPTGRRHHTSFGSSVNASRDSISRLFMVSSSGFENVGKTATT